MAVSTVQPREDYTGTGITGPYPFPHFMIASTDLIVALDNVEQSSGFTVSGSGSSWNVNFTTAVTSGVKILLRRSTPITQASDYQENDPAASARFEADLDKGTAIDQELQVGLDTRIGYSQNEGGITPSDTTLPLREDRKNKALTFDASGYPQASTLDSNSLTNNALNVTYDPSGTGAESTTQEEVNKRVVDAFDFLTDAEKADVLAGTGAYDVSAALQDAINHCNYGERSLRIRAGEYYTGTTSLVVNGPIRIHGEGMGQAYGDSFGALCTTIRYVGSDAAVKINTGISKSTLGFVLENIAISGYATGTATATGSYGIRLGADTGSNLAAQGEMRNVRSEGFTVANFHYTNAQGVEVYNCRGQFGTGAGLLQEGGATSGGGNRSNGFTHCLFKQNKKGVVLKEGGNTQFSLTHFEQNDEEGVHIERNASSGSYGFNDFYFDRCHVENNQLTPNTGTAWATSTAYVRGDFVNESSMLYKCVTDHTSGTFATDLTAVKWVPVEYAAQFLVDTALDTGAGGARVFIEGGRMIAKTSETNGIRKNRLWVCNHGNLFKTHARPNLFSYPEGAIEAIEANSAANVRVVDNFSPYIGSPTTTYPIDVTDFWSIPSAAALSAISASVTYEHFNTGDGKRYWGTNEDVYLVQFKNAANGFYGVVTMEDGGLQMEEISDPTAPTANNGILYTKDNGAGKTQLVVRFPTGAVQVIATEP